MATQARRLAFRILREVEGGGATLADLLSSGSGEPLPPREAGFLRELVLGTLRHRGVLDHALAALLDRPFERLDAATRTALRLGAYQVLRLRVPDRAAVSETVDLARAAAPRSAGLVNAVLRRLSREGARPLPEASDPAAWLTTAGSLPPWLADRWLERLGPALAMARARAFLEPAPSVFRLNPRVPDASQQVLAAGLSPQARLVPGAFEATAGRPADLALAGVLYLQDEGSQLVAHLAATPGLLLDACAAPGGKATLMADLVAARGSVVACEASPRRLKTLVSLVRRWGARNVWPLGGDALRPPFRTRFDAILVDAPCSGLGTLGRHPDIRWNTRPEDVPRHAARQRELLESLVPLLRQGSRLVYSTCSAEPEENEGVMIPFLADHPRFRPGPVPGWAASLAEGPFLRTRPEMRQGDAFFAAVLVHE